MHWKARNESRYALTIFLAILISVAFLTSLPSIRALPVVVQTKHCHIAVAAQTIACTFTSNVTQQNTILAIFAINSPYVCTVYFDDSVAQSYSASSGGGFLQTNGFVSMGTAGNVYVGWTTMTPGTQAVTVNAFWGSNTGCATTNVTANIDIFELSGITFDGVQTFGSFGRGSAGGTGGVPAATSASTTQALPYTSNNFLIAVVTVDAAQTITGGSGFTLATAGVAPNSQVEYALGGSVSGSITNFPFTFSSAASYSEIGVVFGTVVTTASTTTATSTVSTSTTTIGGGTISTSAYELIKRRLYFNQAQNNLNIVATVGNLTGGLYAKISRVDINTTTGTVYLAVYAVTASSQSPTASNPLVLLYNKAFTVQNSSTNVALDVRPPTSTQVNAYSYYAVAVFATTSKPAADTHLTSSGITIFTATAPKGTWNDFAVPTNTLPNNFYSGSVSSFSPFAYAVLSYSVGVVTSTTTVTVSGTVSSTVIVTSTSTNVLNSIDPTKAVFWLMPTFFILFFTGLFAAIGVILKRRG